MIIEAWIDSNANAHSKRKMKIEVDEKDWTEMTEEEKSQYVWEEVIQYIDFGWEEA